MLYRVKTFFDKYIGQAEVLPIIFVMGILPLIVKQKDYMTNLNVFSWYSAESYAVDAFNYYKKNFLIAAALIMALLLLVDFLDGSAKIKKKARLIFAALACYELLAVLSCCFSQYRWFTIHGTVGHFETIYVLLAYGILLLYSYCSVRNERDVRAVMVLWGCLLVPMILLGLSQASGNDFYGTKLGSRLIMTKAAFEAGGYIKGAFEKGRVYLSLYNPNYVGAFGALTAPAMMTLCIYSKRWTGRLFYGTLSAGVLICLMGASAKTGLAALAAAVICLGILLRRQIVQKKKLFLAAGAALAALCVCFILIRGENLVKEVEGAVRGLSKNTTVYNLEGIETGMNGVEVAYKGNKFVVQCSVDSSGNMGFLLTDSQGQTLALSMIDNAQYYEIEDERFDGITLMPVTLKDTLAFELNIDGKSRYFTNQTTYAGYYYYSPYGRFTRIRTAPHWGFEGYETLATYRGYTWSRTIPLLKKYIFLGSGPDTFLMVFPQDDYVIKTRYGFEDKLMSKPHNMFLQIGVQTGMLSLVAYITLYAAYGVWSLKVYWKNSMESWLSAAGASIFVGTAAYMMVGLTADSSINVAPVFWCLLGLGMAINHMVEKEAGI